MTDTKNFRSCITVWLCLLLGVPAVVQSQSVSERLQSLNGLLNRNSQQEFLHPDQAFVLSASVTGPESINMDVAIAEGYYLYHDKFTFNIVEEGVDVDQEAVVIPAGKVKKDPSFGSVEVNTESMEFHIPLVRRITDATSITLEYGYQGCKDNSLCYPPIKKTADLLLPAFTATAASGTATVAPSASGIVSQLAPVMISEQDRITQRLAGEGILINMLLFFGAGLLLSLTPCVFPMIPILSGIIVGQDKKVTPAWGFTLSLVYVLAMAATYAVIGILAALAGVNIQAAAQNSWVIGIFSIVFVALALSMFGFYDIRLPAAVQSRLTRLSNSQDGGTLTGVAVMGAVSAVIVGPCVAPPLVGALAYISQTGDEMLGGLALFAMGMGMGVPLLVIGGSAGTLLPRAGLWMDTVKKVFGVGLLALAIWFLGRVIPPAVELYLWGALLIVTAVYMGAFDNLDKSSSWRRLWKGIGLIMLIYGALLVIGAASGSSSIYRPLQGITGGNGAAQEHGLAFNRIKTTADLDAALATASAQGRPVMLDFYADWCIECIRMESNTFPDSGVQSALADVFLLQADVTANDKQDKALLERFGIYGPPAIIFFDRDGEERTAYRLYGYYEPEEFIAHVTMATDSSQ